MRSAERNSVTELVARFSLRARARRSEYLGGRWPAESEAVIVQSIEAHGAVLTVGDGVRHYGVAVTVSDERLIAACDCAGASPVCRHLVATEPALVRRLVP